MKRHSIISKSIDKFYRFLHKKETALLQFLTHLKRIIVHACRWLWYGSAALLLLIAILFTVVRILLPAVAEKKVDIEQYLSKKSGYKVEIKKIDAYWDGLHPGFRVQGIRVYSKNLKWPAAEFNDLRASLVLLPLVWGQVEINRLVLVKPKLAFERLKTGKYHIRGFDPLKKKESTQRADGGFVRWLFGQGLLAIEGGEIIWRDYLSNESPIKITNLNLSLRNKGNYHQLAFSANFPKKMCQSCSVVIGINGNPLVDERGWSGQTYLQAQGLNLGNLPYILRQKIPSRLTGLFNVELWSDWAKGRPKELNGNIGINKLQIPLKNVRQPLKINEVNTSVKLVMQKRKWKLDLSDLIIRFNKKPWYAGDLSVSHQPDRNTIRLRYVDIANVARFISRIKKKNKAIDIIRRIRPSGRIGNLVVTIEGDITAPNDFTLSADLARIAVKPIKRFPGVEGINGRLYLSRYSGKFLLNTGRAKLALPKVFRKPIWIKSANGQISWKREGKNWFVKARKLRAFADDARGEGTVDVRVPVDRSISPWVKVNARFQDGNIANAYRYFPINVLSKKTIAWLDSAVRSGTVTSGYVIYDGAARKFPRKPEYGNFETALHIKNAEFRYLPGWPGIKNADVDVQFKRSRMLVAVNAGHIGDLHTRMLVVQSDDLSKKSKMPVNVSGRVVGNVNETINVLRTSLHKTNNEWRHLLMPGLSANGDGSLNLKLMIWPSRQNLYQLLGSYQLHNSRLNIPIADIDISSLRGGVGFTEAGLQSGVLQGRVLGGPAVLKIKTKEYKGKLQTQFNIQGQITGLGLRKAFGEWLSPYVTGIASWGGRVVYKDRRLFVDIKADTKNIRMSYPAPLNKPDGIKGPLIIRSKLSTPVRHVIGLSVGQKTSGLLEYRKGDKGWDFNRGAINLGDKNSLLPKSAGLHITAHTNYLDADPWIQVLRKEATGEGIPGFITYLGGRFRSLDIFGRRYGRTYVSLFRAGTNAWKGKLSGSKVKGQMQIASQQNVNRFRFDLDRLVIPNPKSSATASPPDPRSFPYLNLRVKSLRLWKKEFGRLSLLAAPVSKGWRIYRLNIFNPVMDLRSQGLWRFAHGRHTTDATVKLNAKDIGKTLDLYDTSGYVKGGQADVNAKLSWKGVPMVIHYPSLAGSIDVKAKSGVFLQVSEGAAGRMLRVLDITSIFGYLVGDLRPIFGKGFAFSKLAGQLRIFQGNAATKMSIKGKSAYMGLRGDINIARETYNLKMIVTPRLTGSLTALGWTLWNPATAAWVWVTQKIFRKQIKKGTTTKYRITGTWDKPIVEKLSSPQVPTPVKKEITEDDEDE